MKTRPDWRLSPALIRTAAVLLALLPATVMAAGTCPADPPLEAMSLPRLRAALAARTEALIVAIGSSSTEGAMASDEAHTYPAILQALLNKALPSAQFAVINRGIGGQDAPEELARLDTDAIAVKPQLVIWQVGANGALRHADPAVFRKMVTEGVKRLRAAGIDVILMDNQRSPAVLAAVDHIVLEDALRDIAQENNVNLFSRSHLMDFWAQEGAKPGMFTASDGMHHNDLGYDCMTETLAREILAGLTAPVTVARAK